MITVNAIAPGLTSTQRTLRLVNNDEVMARRLEAIPMGRVGQVEDIANVSLFLSSDCSAFMTGQELVVDGDEAGYWAELARWARS
jgi:NAD(P)-dependent dehydrogenase (short-subunit alcohol dehydrogenase family)